MSSVLEPIDFDPGKFQRELDEFDALLRQHAELSEQSKIQPFFKARKHLTAYVGTFAPNVAVATEICFEYDFWGHRKADIVLGNKARREFCVVEFENGSDDCLFKKDGKKHSEWSPRFEHGFSQLVDWFCHIEDFKNTDDFKTTFGSGHVAFTGLLIMGRSAGLDDARRSRLRWRTDTVSIGRHKLNCLTFDDLHDLLRERFSRYSMASRQVQTTPEKSGLPPEAS